MPEFKKRPQIDKPKTKPIAIFPKQATHILKEKYCQQLDQRPEGRESETSDANNKVEGAGWQTVGKITSYRLRFSQRQNLIKQKERPTTPGKRRPPGQKEPRHAL